MSSILFMVLLVLLRFKFLLHAHFNAIHLNVMFYVLSIRNETAAVMTLLWGSDVDAGDY